MKKLLVAGLFLSFSFNQAYAAEEPTIPELHAYKVYHHAEYMKTTAKQAGGTNTLLHTTKLPIEGKDPVVTPALDHLYTKAIIDLSQGPVVFEFPEVSDDRYFSIMVTDQEHYVTYDEIRPKGHYVFIKEGWKGKVPEGKVISNNRSTYPHMFIRTQVKNPDDLPNALAIQKKIRLEGKVGSIDFENEIQFTIDTHDIYPQNGDILSEALDYSEADHKRLTAWAGQYFATKIVDNFGGFGPIDSEEKGSNDPRIRAAVIVGHLGLPAEHAYYTGIFNNCDGERLNGSNAYTVTMPYEANVSEFWSITRYSAITRNTLPGKQDIYNAYNTKPGKDGNIRITFSAEDPKDGTYWMPVIAGEPYYYVERFYGPKGKIITTQDFCDK